MVDRNPQGQLHLIIGDEQSLMEAIDYCHDGAVDPRSAAYHEPSQSFHLKLWRESEGEIIATRVPFLKRRTNRWVPCDLIFRQVVSAEIDRRFRDEVPDNFNTMRYSASTGTLELVMDISLEIRLRVSRLDGELRDSGGRVSRPTW
jgi:hypothetical protein